MNALIAAVLAVILATGFWEEGVAEVPDNSITVNNNSDTIPPVTFMPTEGNGSDTTITSPTKPTTPATSSTTPQSNSSTTSRPPTTPATVSTSSSSTTVSSPPTNTTANPLTSTASLPTSTVAPHKGNRFDGPSFIGGIILATGLMGIGFVAFKFYKARTERNYHTL